MPKYSKAPAKSIDSKNPFDPEKETEKFQLYKEYLKTSHREVHYCFITKTTKEQVAEQRVDEVYDTYRKRRNSFSAINSLGLNPRYSEEKKDQNYPGTKEKVDYRSKKERGEYNILFNDGFINSEKIKSTIGLIHKDNFQKEKIIFTRRGSQKHLLSATIKHRGYFKYEDREGEKITQIKRNQTIPKNAEEIKRTQHSTFNSGENVANAGYLIFDNKGKLTEIMVSSGHYAPGNDSAIKLAIWSDIHKNALGDEIKYLNHLKGTIDTSIFQKVRAVENWARKNPKRKKIAHLTQKKPLSPF